MASNYQPTIPTGSVPLSIDYVNLQKNFAQLDTSFDVNHFLFSDQTTNNGKHSIVEYVNQITPTGLPVGEFILYSKQNASPSSSSQLYYQQDNLGVEVQLTGLVSGNVTPSSNTQGYSYLPGGILVQWGRKAITTTGSVTFATIGGNINFPTALWHVYISVVTNTAPDLCNIGFYNPTTTGFNILTSSGSNLNIHYLCIGN